MTPREVVLPAISLDPEELARRLVTPMPRPPYKVVAHRPDHPLKIGDIEIPCFVLENEERVLSQRGITDGVGMVYGGRYSSGDDAGVQIPDFARRKWLRPFIQEDLLLAFKSPIPFANPDGGGKVNGYPRHHHLGSCGRD